jgi:hypothetical protein
VVDWGGGFVFSLALRGRLRVELARLESLSDPSEAEATQFGTTEASWLSELEKQRTARGSIRNAAFLVDKATLPAFRPTPAPAVGSMAPLPGTSIPKNVGTEVQEKILGHTSSNGKSLGAEGGPKKDVSGSGEGAKSAREDGDRDLKATKADDAAVPVWL